MPEGVDLSAWAGASSGLLDDSDVAEHVYGDAARKRRRCGEIENRWVLGLVNSWRRDGARLIAEGGLSAADIVAALDATEPS